MDPRLRPPPDETNVLVAVVICFVAVAIVAIVIWLVVRWRRARALARHVRLGDLDVVTLTGTVRATERLLTAPLSGRPCVLHCSRARIFEGPASTTVIAEPTETQVSRFVVETPSGTLVVDGSPELGVGPSRIIPPQPERETAFLRKHEVASTNAFFDEIVVEPGSKITIRGTVRVDRDDAAERGYRDAPTRMQLVDSTISQLW